MRCLRVFFLLIFVGPALSVWAQVFDLEKDRVPITELQGMWRFQTGDNPAWADLRFDDSSWPLLRSDETWGAQGYPGYSGFAWYRFRVIPAPGDKSLALLIPFIGNSYEVYANGNLIGRKGGMPPHGRVITSSNDIIRLPDGDVRPGQPIVMAVRVWVWPFLTSSRVGGPQGAPLVGDPGAIQDRRRFEIQRTYWGVTDASLLLLVNLLTSLLGFVLFALRRNEREYLWYGAAQLVWTASSVANLGATFIREDYVVGLAVSLLASRIGAFLNLEFFLALLRKPRRIAYWIGATSVLMPIVLFWPALAGWMSLRQMQWFNSFSYFPYAIVVPLLLFRSGRERNMEARLLFIPFSISSLYMGFSYLAGTFGWLRYAPVAAVLFGLQKIISWPFPVSFGNLIGLLCNLSVCAILILRFARSRRDEERMASELEAARAVQHVLIPDEIPAIPGFAVECVYHPAGQVGGDFFQILPQPSGGALIAIGDVSGKGMPAAMMVSLLVGTLHTAAETTSSPADLLSALNRRIIGRTGGGFTTCLILNISSDGVVRAANAGHLAPYMDGAEILVDNGLPLGLDPGAVYSETVFELGPAMKLTLLTDGVVEARSATGELFGFERTRSIAAEPADKVAQTACAFGQEDDITVLSLVRVGADQKTAAHRPSLSPASA